MNSSLNVLLIEDDPEHAEIISRHMRRANQSYVKLLHQERLADGIRSLSNHRFDAILLDLRLPDSDIDSTLRDTLSRSDDIPIVVLSSIEDRDLALKSVHEGAQDYLVKADLTPELLVRTISSAIERKRNERKIRRQVQRHRALFDLGRLVIESQSIPQVLDCVVNLIASNLEVELVSVLEILPDRMEARLIAGIGWEDGMVGTSTVPTDDSSITGYTLRESQLRVSGDLGSHTPIVFDAFGPGTPLPPSPPVAANGGRSGMAVVIHGKVVERPYGLIGAFSKMKRIFTQEDATFLQTIANTLAGALLRFGLESELKDRIVALDAAHRRKDEFLATLSHELRTPLNAINGFVEIMKTSDPSSIEFAEALVGVERNARIESSLVSDALDVSRIITGKMSLDVSTFGFSSCLRSAIDSIRFAASAKGVSLEVIDNGIENFVGDEAKIRQAIWNLLSNAVKFTPAGGRVVVTVASSREGVELTVADTGVGIEKENQKHVFERFWQEDASFNRRFMGLGIGLSIVRQIVELHGGRVCVASDGRFKGTTFKIVLPSMARPTEVAPHGDVGSAQSRIDLAAAPMTSRLDRIRVLAVDDSKDALFVLQRLLKKRGASVVACDGAVPALEEIRIRSYDVIVSDIGMPEVDGYEFIRRVRALERGKNGAFTPAIALSAHVTDRDRENAIQSGFQIHLPKPIEIHRVEEAIMNLLSSTMTRATDI